MEICKKVFNCNFGDEFNIYFIGDIHEGNCNHAEPELKRAVKMIAEEKNSYWIGMGDYVEAISVDDKKRFDPITMAKKYNLKDLKDLPYKQLQNVYKNLKPIDDKCLALICGNHEASFIKHNSSDIYDRFANMFESKPFKLGYVGFVKLGFIHHKDRNRPDYNVLISLNHGDGGSGFREGYPVNKIHDVFRWSDGDINVMGHIHQLVEDDKKVIGVTQADKLSKRKKYFGSSGCFLWTYQEGNTNYFEHKGRNESDIGMLKATIKIKREPEITLTKIKLG